MRKKKNIRREIAKRLYVDPESDTFLNKSKSLIKAGYKKSTALDRGSEMLGDIEFTPIDYAKFDTFFNNLPQIDDIVQQKLDILRNTGKINAKDFANLLRYYELAAKLAGLLKDKLEKTTKIIKIEIPREIVEKEYQRREEKEADKNESRREYREKELHRGGN